MRAWLPRLFATAVAVMSYDDDDEPSFSMKLEITKLISEAFERRYFLVPGNYKKITK